MTRSLRNAGLVVIGGMILLILSTAAMAIPLYTVGWDADLDLSSDDRAETLELIREYGRVHSDNINGRNADILVTDPDLELAHYVGFSNLWYAGQDSVLDRDDRTPIDEHAFYHHCDPATVSGWRTATGVSLHWTRDLRFATSSDIDPNIALTDSFGYFDESAAVNSYLVVRTSMTLGDSLRFPVSGLSYDDGSADADSLYYYEVRSIHDAREYAFSSDAVSVDTVITEGPKFWASKPRHQEAFYYREDRGGVDNPITWPIRFHCDKEINPTYVTIEVYRQVNPDSTVVFEYDSSQFEYDIDTYDISLDLSTSTIRFLGDNEPGGVFYRLRYFDGVGDTLYFPEDTGASIALISSSINNRVLSRNWTSYQMNLGSDAWRDILTEFVRALNDGTGPLVRYGTVLFDSATGVLEGVTNWVRPYDYGGETDHGDAVFSLLSNICQNPEFNEMKFVPNLGFDVEMIGRFATANYSTFGGCWDDKLTFRGDSDPVLLNMLWEHHAPERQATPVHWRNISQERIDLWSNYFDREQALVGYLLTRESTLTGGDEDDLLGYSASWTTPSRLDVNITPEQLLRVGDEVNDVLASYNWPEAAAWVSTLGAPGGEITILSDLEVQTGINNAGIVHRGAHTTFLSRTFYLEDGSPAPDPTIRALWDMDEDLPAPRTYTLAEIFPDLAPGDTLYALEFDNDPTRVDTHQARVVDGARFFSKPVLANAVLEASVQKAPIYFSAPVSSPDLDPDALETLSGDPPDTSTLMIHARHWNGQPLEIEVDCTNIGGSNLVNMTWVSDTTYAVDLTQITVPKGSYELPVRLEGSDGLLLYDHINVEVVAPSVTRYVDRTVENGSAQVNYSSPNGAMPYSSVTIDYDGLEPRDLVVSLVGLTAKVYQSSGLTIDGGIAEFELVTDLSAFPSGDFPNAVLGLAVADFNNDGQEDLFAASQAGPRIYGKLPGSGYVDFTASMGLDPQQLLESTTGAWADYDRDGDVDLMIGTSACGAPGVPGYGGPTREDILLRNDLSTYGGFVNVSVAAGIQPDNYTNCATIAWGDVNNDGYPDAFIGDANDGSTGGSLLGSRLFVNQQDGTFVEDLDSWMGERYWVIGAQWRDMDGDGNVDLEIAEHWRRTTLYADSTGDLNDAEFSAVVSWSDPATYSGLRLFDHDLDGHEDVLLLPEIADAPPRLLVRTNPANDREYANLAAPIGLDAMGRVGGTVAADMNGDGDIDLFLGREATQANMPAEQNLFQSTVYGSGSDVPVNEWLGVRISAPPGGLNSTTGVGAKVTLTVDGQARIRSVDGGSGRGGQDDPTLIFGLGSSTTTLNSLVIDWPNGNRQIVPLGGTERDQVITVVDDSQFEVVAGSTLGSYEIIPNTLLVDWIFTWETSLIATTALDMVEFDIANMDPDCAAGLVTLTPTTDGVDHSVEALPTGGMRHTMIWRNRPCLAPCMVIFRTHSEFQSKGLTAESPWRPLNVNFCPSKELPGMG